MIHQYEEEREASSKLLPESLLVVLVLVENEEVSGNGTTARFVFIYIVYCKKK